MNDDVSTESLYCQCFHPLPASALSMFKTGRSDCQPSGAATEFQQYLASRAEHHPDDNGNGEMTVSYYDREEFSILTSTLTYPASLHCSASQLGMAAGLERQKQP